MVQHIARNAYKLELPPSMSRLHPVFNVVKLMPALADPIPGRQVAPLPPPELVDGEEHYKLKSVLDSRLHRIHFEYLVNWKGYVLNITHGSWIVTWPLQFRNLHCLYSAAGMLHLKGGEG